MNWMDVSPKIHVEALNVDVMVFGDRALER